MIECFSQSTAHGLSHLGNEPTYIGKFVWALLTICAVSVFSIHTFTLSKQLLEEQLFIATYPNAVEFMQPDIVFCSERIFARDFMSNPPDSEYEYMMNASRAIQDFDQRYRNFKYKSTKLIWDSLNVHQLYKAFYHRKHEFFLNVTCNFEKVDLSNIQIEFSFNNFACYRLKADVCKLKSPFDYLVLKFYIHLYTSNRTFSALDVNISNRTLDSYLFIQREYVDEVADGVHLYFVQPNEAIHGRTKKITASANTHTDIRVKSTQYKRQSSMKAKCQEEVKYDQFYNLLEENMRENPLNYTEHSLCVYKQFQYLFVNMLNCVSKQLPIPLDLPRNVTFCGDIFTQKDYRVALYSKITTGELFKQKEILEKCRGTIPCISVRYQTSVNYNTWPWAKSLIRMLTVDIPKKLERESKNYTSPGLIEAVTDYQNNPGKLFSWTKNFIKVSISSDEFMSTLVEESPSYSLKNIFSDVGGIMGFYMGASLLTVCELFRVLYFTICALMPSNERDEVNDDHSIKDETV